MKVNGIIVAAIVVLAFAGCAQPNEEKVEADQILSDLLAGQLALVKGQDGLTELLGEWNVWGTSRYIKKELGPVLDELEGLSARRNVNPYSDKAARKVFRASNNLRKATEQVEEMLDGYIAANTAPELVDPRPDGPNPPPPTPTGPIRTQVDSVESETLVLEELLLRSAEASAEGFAAIEAGLEETGDRDDRATSQIDEGSDLADQLEQDSGLAAREFGNQLGGYLSNILETIEKAQDLRLPDGACAEQAVGYPSTLGKPSVYVYVAGGVPCEFGKNLALELYSIPEFRGTGVATWTPPETGPLPEWAEAGFTCELGQVSPTGDPRVVICFAEDEPGSWTAPRVSFQAPSTAG